jgi:hypothetical protein
VGDSYICCLWRAVYYFTVAPYLEERIMPTKFPEDFFKAQKCHWHKELGRPVFEGEPEFDMETWHEVRREGLIPHVEDVLKLNVDHRPEDTALSGGCVIDIKDNREEFRKRREVGETCRVCGSKEVHSTQYNRPTMDCVEFLRQCMSDMRETIEELMAKNSAMDWELNPENMGK